jgi:hypothetical protein
MHTKKKKKREREREKKECIHTSKPKEIKTCESHFLSELVKVRQL